MNPKPCKHSRKQVVCRSAHSAVQGIVYWCWSCGALRVDGRKTQTRRTTGLDFINKDPSAWTFVGFDHGGIDNFKKESTGSAGVALFQHSSFEKTGMAKRIKCPYGVPGDRLWVRENFATDSQVDHIKPSDLSQGEPIFYPATNHVRIAGCHPITKGKDRPSIHMPRWASRILLEVTDVRAERVQEISPADAVAEGIKSIECPASPIIEFASLWNSINFDRGYGWDVSPWVWAVTFKLLEGEG